MHLEELTDTLFFNFDHNRWECAINETIDRQAGTPGFDSSSGRRLSSTGLSDSD